MPEPAYFADPERTMAIVVVGRLRTGGYEDVRPGPALLDGDDLGIDIAVELAFSRMDGLFPALIESARRMYVDTWLDHSGAPWPFVIEPDVNGLLGRRVRYNGDANGLTVAMLCVVGALEQWVASSLTPPPVLAIQGEDNAQPH